MVSEASAVAERVAIGAGEDRDLGDLGMARRRAHLAYRPAEGAHRLEIGARRKAVRPWPRRSDR
jgi:hypothetical protein